MSDVYETAADMLGQSIGFGAVPRNVVLRKLREGFPNPADLQAKLEEARRLSEALIASGLTIAYDRDALERVREEQRKLV